MSKHLNKTVGIACLSTLLQVSSSAQSAQPAPQIDQSAKSFNPSSSKSSTSGGGEVAVVSEAAGAKIKREVSKENSVTEPRIGLKNPSIDLKVAPREARLSERQFAAPDNEILGEPKLFRATAYALRGRTRSGVYVRRGVIAADPRVLPLGSVVQLKAGDYSGVYTVHDTGGRIKGNIIDVWVPSTREARIFGRRRIKVHVLRFGPRGAGKQK